MNRLFLSWAIWTGRALVRCSLQAGPGLMLDECLQQPLVFLAALFDEAGGWRHLELPDLGRAQKCFMRIFLLHAYDDEAGGT